VDTRDRAALTGRRLPAATAAALLSLAALSVGAALVLSGTLSLTPRFAPGGAVFYVVTYHYGFAFYDRDLVEVDAMEARVGETVTLYIVPAQALPETVFLAYAERSLKRGIGGLAPGDAGIRAKLMEDLALGNVEHIVGIASHPVYVTTDVSSVLGGHPFRKAGPTTLAEAVSRRDPAIKRLTFKTKKVGDFDVLCIDSGMDGAGTCGWGHKWMVAKNAFVVRPRRRPRGAHAVRLSAIEGRCRRRYAPVLPKPPSPRVESGSRSTSTSRACATGWMTSWAMRSPRPMPTASAPWLIRSTFSSPR